MLIAILDPNRDVDLRSRVYDCTLKTDVRLRGMIISERRRSFVIAAPDGEQRRVIRSKIRSLVGSDVSLRPEGLEREMDLRSMADLLAFLKAGAKEPLGFVCVVERSEIRGAARSAAARVALARAGTLTDAGLEQPRRSAGRPLRRQREWRRASGGEDGSWVGRARESRGG